MKPLDLGTDGLTLLQVKAACPNFIRVLAELADYDGYFLSKKYRWQRKSMATDLPKAEAFAATIDFSDDELLADILTVDCDRYNELVMEKEGGPEFDRLIADLYDGQDSVDTYGFPLFTRVGGVK
jgi:hypothetical protein